MPTEALDRINEIRERTRQDALALLRALGERLPPVKDAAEYHEVIRILENYSL